ncbi:hypothetical protein G3A42_30700 [Paraburkholderia aspalathi]|nr:hypothetical protein [Paraburkholderia aspalathi]
MSNASDPDAWASDEFGAAQLGDARLTQRLIAFACRLSGAPQCSFPQSLKGAEQVNIPRRSLQGNRPKILVKTGPYEPGARKPTSLGKP